MQNSVRPRSYATSSMQKRLCLAQEVFQDATYNVPAWIRLTEAPFHRIAATLNGIVKGHTILRTRLLLSLVEYIINTSKTTYQAHSVNSMVEMATKMVITYRWCKSFVVENARH
jgi:hypothetical protein